MKYEIKDYLYSINQSKKNILEENPQEEKNYLPFVVNKCFSMHTDSILYANEMNINHHLDKKLQYDFFINSLKPRKRFSTWVKNCIKEDIEIVREYYGYNYEKANQALNILTNDQLAQIKKMLNKGG